MKFKIRNFIKVKEADIDVESITCIAGKNMAGKTSALRAITAVMTGIPTPSKKITKKQMSRIVHSGTSSGSVELIDKDTSIAKIVWPDCTYEAASEHKTISDISAGFVSIADMDTPSRLSYIIRVANALPTEVELQSELKIQKMYPPNTTISTKDSYKKLWDSIQLNGWEVTYQKTREGVTKLKGAWEQVTGLNYGVRIAEGFEPENFTEDLKNASLEKLEKEKDAAQEWCEAAAKECVLSEREVEELKVKASKLTELEKTQQIIETKDCALEKTVVELIKKRDTQEIRGIVCPSCKVNLTLTNGVLKKIPQNEEVKNFSDYDSDIKSIRAQQKIVLTEFSENKSAINKSLEAIEKLKKLPTKTSEKSLEEVSGKLAIATDRLEAYNKYHQAHTFADKITKNNIVASILSPQGLRAKVLKKKIDGINKVIRQLTTIAMWETIEFNHDGEIIVDGVPYHPIFLSRSQQYRVKLILNIFVAIAEKNKIVIIDDLDKIMSTQRREFIKILLALVKKGMKFVIAVAYDLREDMPDFGKIGGKSYWIENGKVD